VSERKRDEKEVGALSAFGKKRALDIMTPKKVSSWYPLLWEIPPVTHIPIICSNIVWPAQCVALRRLYLHNNIPVNVDWGILDTPSLSKYLTAPLALHFLTNFSQTSRLSSGF